MNDASNFPENEQPEAADLPFLMKPERKLSIFDAQA